MFALLALLAGPPQEEPVPIDLTTLSVAEARRLAGRGVVFDPELVADAVAAGRWDAHENASADDAVRTVWLPAGTDPAEIGRAAGVLEVIDHPGTVGADGTEFPAFTEVRIQVSSWQPRGDVQDSLLLGTSVCTRPGGG